MFVLRDAHEWLISRGRSDEASSVQKLLEFRQHSTPSAYRVHIDLENIEELFSLAAAVDDSLTRHICIAIAATLDFRAAARPVPETEFNLSPSTFGLPASLIKNAVRSNSSPSFHTVRASAYDFMLAGLIGRLDAPKPLARDTIISFNYDMLVEDSLSSLRTPFSYGFSPKSVTEDPSAQGLSLSANAPLQLLKLHGSINWAYPGHRGRRLTVFGSYEPVRAAGLPPQLIPPTWRKTFDGPLLHVWRHALDQISTATRLVVIGFSMPATDLHFKYLIAAGLRENISLREIVFVNTDKKNVEIRAAELFGDLARRPSIRVVPTTARTFVGQGEFQSTISSIGRSMSPAIQQIHHVT
jgi:hypothetical protein